MCGWRSACGLRGIVMEQLLPQGRLRECVRLIGSAVIGIIVLACARDAANILTEIKTEKILR